MTIFFFQTRESWKEELPFAGYSVVTLLFEDKGTPLRRSGKIVWDDRLCDEVGLRAALRTAGPQANHSIIYGFAI